MPEKLFPYSRFVGLDAIADRRQMGERFLEICEHAFVDLRGQINKLPGHKTRTPYTLVAYSEHYGDNVVITGAWNSTTGMIDWHIVTASTGAVTAGHASAWGFGSDVDFVHFLNAENILVEGKAPVTWDGTAFAVTADTVAFPSTIWGGCGATLMARMVVSAYGPKYTEIAVSRVSERNFEIATGTGADNAVRFDIRDDLTAQDRVMGLGVFEGNKLAIFCQNETLLYVADPDINNWQLLRDFRVPIGTIGKRTIKRVGNDLFFASKFGVHSIRRAVNGITLESITFSRVIQDIYFHAVQNMHAVWRPRAVWDPNKGHYHLFIPQNSTPPGDVFWSRFTFTIEPSGRQPHLSWGYTPNADWADGTYFNGILMLAVYRVGLCEDDMRYETDTSRMRARTAVLYQGSPQREKNYKRLYVRASGDAKFKIRVYNQDLEVLEDDLLSTYPDNDGSFYTPERPLDLPFEHRAYGVQVEFISEDVGDCRIMDFAIVAE